MLTVMWVKVRMCRNVCELACGRGEIFFLFILFLCTCVCDLVCACHGVVVNLKCSTFLAVISEYSTVSVIPKLFGIEKEIVREVALGG